MRLLLHDDYFMMICHFLLLLLDIVWQINNLFRQKRRDIFTALIFCYPAIAIKFSEQTLSIASLAAGSIGDSSRQHIQTRDE